MFSEEYKDRPCEEAATEVSNLRNGELAPRGSGPFSVYFFFIIMSAFAYGTFYILKQRRDNIISQVYSNLSIVKTKN